MSGKDDEIAALIEATKLPDDPNEKPLDSRDRFIREFPLVPGPKMVSTEIIYHFYVQFCLANNLEPVSTNWFFYGFKNRGFKKVCNPITHGYKVEPELLRMTEEELLELQRKNRYYKHIWLPRAKSNQKKLAPVNAKRKAQREEKKRLAKEEKQLKGKSKPDQGTSSNSQP